MPVLFLLDTGRNRTTRGFARGPVPAREGAVYGHYHEGRPYGPDPVAVRECLPAQWRKAFDRGGRFWCDRDDNAAPHMCSLRDRDGRHIATLYATPIHV